LKRVKLKSKCESTGFNERLEWLTKKEVNSVKLFGKNVNKASNES